MHFEKRCDYYFCPYIQIPLLNFIEHLNFVFNDIISSVFKGLLSNSYIYKILLLLFHPVMKATSISKSIIGAGSNNFFRFRGIYQKSVLVLLVLFFFLFFN